MQPAAEFESPTIEGVELTPDCVKTLKLIDLKHELGNASQKLLTWYPLSSLASSANPIKIIINVASTDWAGLGSIAVGLENIKNLAIQRDCELMLAVHQAARRTDRKLIQFWKAMKDFYAHQSLSY